MLSAGISGAWGVPNFAGSGGVTEAITKPSINPIGIAASAVPMITGAAGLGQVSPVAQGALSGAGMGASVGAFGGPVGAGIGAGAGALLGGVSSAIGKGGGAKPAEAKSDMPSTGVKSVASTPKQNMLPSTASNPQQPTRKSFALNLLKQGYS